MSQNQEDFLKNVSKNLSRLKYLRWLIPLFFLAMSSLSFYVAWHFASNAEIDIFSILDKPKNNQEYSSSFIISRDYAVKGIFFIMLSLLFAIINFTMFKRETKLLDIISVHKTYT